MIHHITRRVPPEQLEPCIEFYGRLGFYEVAVPAGIAGRARWLEHTGVQLHLMPAPGATPEAGHIAIVPDDYAATLSDLTRTGHPVQMRTAHWGTPRAYVTDPAGNTVELMQSPPHPPQSGR